MPVEVVGCLEGVESSSQGPHPCVLPLDDRHRVIVSCPTVERSSGMVLGCRSRLERCASSNSRSNLARTEAADGPATSRTTTGPC